MALCVHQIKIVDFGNIDQGTSFKIVVYSNIDQGTGFKMVDFGNIELSSRHPLAKEIHHNVATPPTPMK